MEQESWEHEEVFEIEDLIAHHSLEAIVTLQTIEATDEDRTITEWHRREVETKVYPRIHHYSWYGRPVFHSVGTPPEESLAVIQAEPKYPTGSAQYRIKSVINRAMNLVDPVLVNIERFNPDLWAGSGSDLMEGVKGRVRKLYSPHGEWMKGGFGNDFAIVDLAVNELWDPLKVLLGNGIHENEPIPTWEDWHIWQKRRISQIQKTGPPRLLTWRPRKSPLSTCQVQPLAEMLTSVKLDCVSEKPASDESTYGDHNTLALYQGEASPLTITPSLGDQHLRDSHGPVSPQSPTSTA
ncbi:hypothetical protein N7541_009706 [Penicillium brevicompactum]|uniref:Uncharacterized protein n=1 Tax=Penicillium brevicompactum TaxID=5074 RepID=A0A9W9UGX9_PENBR|nr:hypothetical protein N7541_009706 [Penicillium brevicompactum]